MNRPYNATLLLEDGTYYKGYSFGKVATTSGEICFNTGMTGYQEIYTDPSYFGQILVQTSVHIGNYGTNEMEVESDSIKISGLVCRNLAAHFSRKQADSSLEDYFVKHGMTGIGGIDTRSLVLHIRDKGAMNAIISSEILSIEELKQELAKVPSMGGLELSSKVTTDKFYSVGSDQLPLKIAVLDFGLKKNITRCLEERNAHCGVFPAHASAKEILDWNPDGIMLSNGPGDPSAMPYAVATIKTLLETNIPMFGICLGNQLLGLACGLKTFKMHNGHRGLNHPVKNLKTGLSEITSQNHGFSLTNEMNSETEITHINLNDNTIEGVRLKNRPAFAVQYHPESSPGPHDSRYLFDDFISLINQHKNN
jgi:carbamoyl-phosphate synthase small subunit